MTVSDGAGTPRDGLYSRLSEPEMVAVRNREQRKAAFVGEYSAVALLGHPSALIKDAAAAAVSADLEELFRLARPEVVYTHSPLDRHDTHVAVSWRVVEALRRLPPELRPRAVHGMEVWRDMDWILDADKRVFDISGHDNLAAALMEVYDSQNCGKKRYDKGTLGRRAAHATFLQSHHHAGDASALALGIDLTPLVDDPGMSVPDFALGFVERFKDNVKEKLQRLGA